jgi:hypothetical protein
MDKYLKTLCIDIDPIGRMKTKIIKSGAIMKKYQSKAQSRKRHSHMHAYLWSHCLGLCLHDENRYWNED